MMEAFASAERLHVCPIFGFGETEVFDNIRIPQAFQEAAVKLLRANVIYCMATSFLFFLDRFSRTFQTLHR